MIYFDSSALVKRYLKEKGTDVVLSLTTREEFVATSKLAYPELLSTFMRKNREGGLREEPLKSILNRLEADWLEFFIIEIHDELFPLVKSLIRKYPLKGADSIHLASALWLESMTKTEVMFIASDMSLLDAATKENLKILNPQG
jgi:predicted nucleic acid-binding protein